MLFENSVGGSISPDQERDTLRKQKEKSLILEALGLKKLRGSVIMEFVKCGRKCARCNMGPGHPASYLHYYDSACTYKVRRKYLTKKLAQLMSHSREELEQMLHDVEPKVLGQERKEAKVEILSFKQSAKAYKRQRW